MDPLILDMLKLAAVFLAAWGGNRIEMRFVLRDIDRHDRELEQLRSIHDRKAS